MGSRVPIRTCLGCRRRLPKEGLVRLVIGEGGLSLGEAQGRGRYVCRDRACLEAALKRKDLRGLLAGAACEPALAQLKSLAGCWGEARIDGGGERAACEANGGGAIG
jgi:predicted RNA-binding protein YlxR (DUF448 family)